MADNPVNEDPQGSPDPHFEPVIRLPEVDVKTFEEDEEELLKLRAKLYRYVTSSDGPPEWKDRGTGFVKLLKHKEKGSFRLLMRRDKTLKVCANHNITPWMDLKANCGSDRAWVWSVAADFADEIPTEEMLAIKFGNVENANKFKAVFEDCQLLTLASNSEESYTESDSDKLTDELGKLAVEDNGETDDSKAKDSLNSTDDSKENSVDSHIKSGESETVGEQVTKSSKTAE